MSSSSIISSSISSIASTDSKSDFLFKKIRLEITISVLYDFVPSSLSITLVLSLHSTYTNFPFVRNFSALSAKLPHATQLWNSLSDLFSPSAVFYFIVLFYDVFNLLCYASFICFCIFGYFFYQFHRTQMGQPALYRWKYRARQRFFCHFDARRGLP